MGIQSISPIDGRYFGKVKELSAYFSEFALIKYRIIVEIKFLESLSEKNIIRKFTNEEQQILADITNISIEDAEIVKDLETKGYEGIPATNHDVKAIEYFIKLKLKNTSLTDVLEMIHFGLTSEDTNNTSYAMMIRDGINQVIIPVLIDIYEI